VLQVWRYGTPCLEVSYQAWEEGSSNSWEVRQWEAINKQGRKGSIKESLLLMPGKGTHG
jgi:hypothetical protein